MIVALNFERFGGVLGLILVWFGALLGPTAMPLLLGLLPAFKRCGPVAAITSIAGGVITFIIMKSLPFSNLAMELGLPTIISAIIFIGVGMMTKTIPQKVLDLHEALKKS